MKVAAALLLCCLNVNAAVTEHVLDNGLKVSVSENHRAPAVVLQVWYKVGSSYENTGHTGISHMLEHMMFKGTPAVPADGYAKAVANYGGQQNAHTGLDFTFYYQRINSQNLEEALKLEADRMTNLNLNEDDLKTELNVVAEERRVRTEDAPGAKMYEQLMATAYANSPYQNPVIGWPSDIQNYKIEDVRSWYQKWYAPNNATLVIVGDVDSQKALELVEQYFGSLDAHNIEAINTPIEMPQLGTKRIDVALDIQLPSISMGYKVPTLGSVDQEWEVYALEALAYSMGVGNSARLVSHLIRGQSIATSTSASYNMRDRLTSLFNFEAVPLDGHTLAELEEALKAEVQNVKENLISDSELERIKVQMYAHDTYSRDNYYSAVELGRLETEGMGWQKAADYLPKVKAVTALQIQAVAQI